MKTVFVADDGKQFDERSKCLDYEHEQEMKAEAERKRKAEAAAKQKRLAEEKDRRYKELCEARKHFEELLEKYEKDYCDRPIYDTDWFRYLLGL